MLLAWKVILPEIIYNHPIMKLLVPWALDLRIWQGCFTDMVILALFCRRFTFFTKLFFTTISKIVDEEGPKWTFCNTQGERKFCSHIQARAIYLYTDGLLKPPHRRLTYSAKGSQHFVKSRQEMQKNGKRIRSYQLDGPKFSILFSSRENREENLLDSTD